MSLRVGGFEVGDWAWNRFRVIVDVETLVDCMGDGLDFSTEVPLDVVQVESVIPVNKVDSQAKVAVSP